MTQSQKKTKQEAASAGSAENKNIFPEMCEKDYWFVDVDGTLIVWHNDLKKRGIPQGQPRVNHDMVKMLREWHTYRLAHGGEPLLAVWSGMGHEHAWWAVTLAGLKDIVGACLGKPEVIIDDVDLFNTKERRLLGKQPLYVKVEQGKTKNA